MKSNKRKQYGADNNGYDNYSVNNERLGLRYHRRGNQTNANHIANTNNTITDKE